MGDIVRVERGGRFIGWYVRYKDVDGRRKMRASHQPTRALARRYLLEVEGRVARGLLGIPEPPPPAPTVAELCERFLSEYHRPRIRDVERYRRHARTALRRALPLLGSLRLDAVRPADVQRLRDHLGRRFAAASVRLTLNFLGVAFAFARRAGLLTESPLRGVELPGSEPSLEYLQADEVRRLLALTAERARSGAACDALRHACVAFAVYSGLRKGELFGLRWSDVDVGGQRLTVARSYDGPPKSGRSRHLRLPAALAPILLAWRPRCPVTPEDLVFPVLAGRPRPGGRNDTLDLGELLAAAGCRPLDRPWHALRHTFASHFIMSGGNILALQKILGHADIKMTLGYAHLAPDFLGSEMDRVKF